MGQSQSRPPAVPPPLEKCHTTTNNVSNKESSAKKITSSDLKITSTKPLGIRRCEITREQIKKMLNARGDDEMLITQLTVSLTCPLGKMRMIDPCRASTCSHVQCFDASIYIRMNRAKPTWKCPVCNKPASYKDLFIDGYFKEILTSNKLLAGVNNIQLLKDGSWKNIVNKKRPTHNIDKIASLTKTMETMDLTRARQPKSQSQEKSEVIDLASSTNDDLVLPLLDMSSRKICEEILERQKRKWAKSRRKFSQSEIIIID